MRPAGLAPRLAATALLALASWWGPAAPARAQQSGGYSEFIPDSVFDAGPRAPVSYFSQYNRDQARDVWSQNIGYARSFNRFAINMSGSTMTSEDLLGIASKSTSGDLAGRVDWRATHAWLFSLDGQYSMSSITDGARSSESEQRRNRLAFSSQYSFKPIAGVQLMILGSSELQRNYDLRNAERLVFARADTLPDTLSAQRDSSFFSGRLDAVRGSLDWAVFPALQFKGTASGSWTRPTISILTTKSNVAQDGSGALTDKTRKSVRLPADNAGMEGAFAFTGVRATKLTLESKRYGTDQVYFDLGQIRVERFSNDTRAHSFKLESALLRRVSVTFAAAMNRSLREYQARPNLNALVTAREASAAVAYNDGRTFAFTNMTVNRTRAEKQATSNGLTLTRVLSANITHQLFKRLWLVGLGSANLYSYQYVIPTGSNRTFSVDDRDLASTFGSVGARFSVSPHCSTAVSFSANRVHNVSLDATQSSGNVATSVYQINGSLRMPLSRAVSIGQDYIVTATYRLFDYDDRRNDLSRNFRIDTIVADTLSPFAYLRLDHRYYFFDRGDFTAIVAGGPRLYGVQQEQFQQTLEGTVGLRPASGILLIAKQSLADVGYHDVVSDGRNTSKLWNLSLGLEVNRTFWNGAGLIGAVRHEGRYQNVSNKVGSTNREDRWIAGVTFQKEF